MRAFVTGGSGFIGVPLLRALAARGDEVVALTRRPARAPAIGGVRWVRGDVLEIAGLREAAKGCEAVFHLAGEISYKRADAARVFRVNVEGTRNALEAALEAGARRFLHVSSIVAVGASWDPSRALDERAEYGAAKLGLAYFDSKHEAETEALAASGRGFEVVCANPATVVGMPGDSGPAGNVERAIRLLSRFPLALPGGNCWVDVRDVVDGILRAFDRGRPGERYILGHWNATNRELMSRLRSARGKRPPIAPLPGGLLRAAGKLFPAAARVSGFYLFYDSSKAERELGWSSRDPWPAIQAMASPNRIP